MLIIKLIGEKYDKKKLQENSVKIRKWFAIECMKNNNFEKKYYEHFSPLCRRFPPWVIYYMYLGGGE